MTQTLEIDAQYRALREEAGLIDRSGRMRIRVAGGEAAEFLQGQLTNDIEALEPGGGCYAALLDRKGKIRADMRVLRTTPDEFLIDAEPQGGEPIHKHLDMYRIGRDAKVAWVGEDEALLTLIGPRTEQLLGAPLGPEHSHGEITVAGTAVRAIRTAEGADLLVPAERAEAIRDELLGAGAEAVTEEAVEILRVEGGRPRLGHELVSGTMPQEAGINERAVSFTKGCYIGQETVARLHYKGKPNRHLRLLEPEEPVAAGDPVHVGEREVGTIGTAVVSPARGPLALAILRREAEPGGTVAVGDGEGIAATVREIDA